WRESGSEIQTTSKRSLHAKYMWLICARPPADTVARAHRGEAFINRRATRSSTADENLRERRSTVTYLVWPPRQTERKHPPPHSRSWGKRTHSPRRARR